MISDTLYNLGALEMLRNHIEGGFGIIQNFTFDYRLHGEGGLESAWIEGNGPNHTIEFK